MADPTAGPSATAWTQIANPTGADTDPYTGMTTDWSGSGHVALRRITNELAAHSPVGVGQQSYFSAAGVFGPSCEMVSRIDNYGENATWLDMSVGLVNPMGSWTNQELEVLFHDSIPDTLQLYDVDAGAVHASSSLVDHDFAPPEWWAIQKLISGGQMILGGYTWNGTLNSWGSPKVSLLNASPTANMLSTGYMGLETDSAAMRLGPIYGATITAVAAKRAMSLLGVG